MPRLRVHFKRQLHVLQLLVHAVSEVRAVGESVLNCLQEGGVAGDCVHRLDGEGEVQQDRAADLARPSDVVFEPDLSVGQLGVALGQRHGDAIEQASLQL